MKPTIKAHQTDWPQVTRSVAELYSRKRGVLIKRMNDAFNARPDLTELIGDRANIALMEDNHRNHAHFLTTVLFLNGKSLLERVLPWVYRAYQARGFSLAYFALELHQWQNEIRAELPAPEAEMVCAVYQWMEAWHDTTAASLNCGDTATDGSELSPPATTFFQAILERDLSRALDLSRTAASSPEEVPAFYEQIVQPALYEIGNQWEEGRINVAQEHLASAVASLVLSNMYCIHSPAAAKRGAAIITAAPNEFHELGARMVAHSLGLDGWDVSFLGANTPLTDLMVISRDLRPKFVGISMAMPYNLHQIRDFLDEWAVDAELANIPILLGGRLFLSIPETRVCFPTATVVTSCREAVAAARQWA